MKVRKLSLVVALVALMSSCWRRLCKRGRRGPRSASGSRSAVSPSIQVDSMSIVESGPIWHTAFDMWGTVTGSDPRVSGYFALHSLGPTVIPNPHNIPDVAYWGPGNLTWRLEVTNGSGWEGTGHVHPQNDMEKWPDSFLVRANGLGYGEYEGMRIEWTVRSVWDACAYIFEGEITENIR